MASSATPTSDPAPVDFYINSPVLHSPLHLLSIPHAMFALYSSKPRKWLQYVGYAITGKKGNLYLQPVGEVVQPIPCDPDQPVEGGDGYIYCLDEPPVLFDYDLRRAKGSQSMSSTNSRSRIKRMTVKTYGECPFSGAGENLCEACHMIPRSKGDKYMQTLYHLRGNGKQAVGIDDAKNVILLNSLIHTGLDSAKMIAFLKTPNIYMKPDEVAQADGVAEMNPDYCVTLHCFSNNPKAWRLTCHGSTSDLGKKPSTPASAAVLAEASAVDDESYRSMADPSETDSEVSEYSFGEDSGDEPGVPSAAASNADHVPDDLIFDVVYACNLFHSFKVGTLPLPLKEFRNKHYGPAEAKYVQDRLAQQKKEQAKQNRDNANNQREERLVKQEERRNMGDLDLDDLGLDSDSDSSSDDLDPIVLINLALNGMTWQEMKEHYAAVEEKERQSKMLELDEWRRVMLI